MGNESAYFAGVVCADASNKRSGVGGLVADAACFLPS